MTDATIKNRTPSTTGNTQMTCRVEKTKMVNFGSPIPMPPNTFSMDGPITCVQMNASTVEIKNATNITMSG